MTSTRLSKFMERNDTRAEVFREAVLMVLYVSVVEIAALAAIPESHFASGRVTGPVDEELLAILWGTALGLAFAHWFAFEFASPVFRGDRPSRHAASILLAQLGGATFVAALSSVPVLVLSDVRAKQTTGDVPAVLIGIVAYVIARSSGRPRGTALVCGVVALALGILVALIKNMVAAH
jgi:hypothetical protein